MEVPFDVYLDVGAKLANSIRQCSIRKAEKTEVDE